MSTGAKLRCSWCPPILLRRAGARAVSTWPPGIPHASAACRGATVASGPEQANASPTALPQAAAKLLGRPEEGLGHSEPDKRVGNHLSPVAEVGLLRPPRRRQRAARGQASRAPCATGGAIWGTAAWGQLIGTLSTAGGHGAGSYKDLGGSGKLRRCGKPPLCTRFLGSHTWPFRKQRRWSSVPGRSGGCLGCRGGKQCTK